jgi:hypothetical protein
MTLPANGRIDKLTEDAALYPAYLTGTVTGGAAAGLTTRPGAGTATCGANLGSGNFYLFLAAQGCLLKGDRYVISKVITGSGCLARGPAGTTKKGFENISKTAHIKAFKTPPEEVLGTIMSEAVISGTLIGIREDFISLVDFLELLLGTIIVITVRMILERQLTKILFYILIRGITGQTEHLVIVTLYSHIIRPTLRKTIMYHS